MPGSGSGCCLTLADVDTAGEAERIAADAPGSRFAARVRALGPRALVTVR